MQDCQVHDPACDLLRRENQFLDYISWQGYSIPTVVYFDNCTFYLHTDDYEHLQVSVVRSLVNQI